MSRLKSKRAPAPSQSNAPREAVLEIEKLVYGGDGLARLASDAEGRRMAVFVPFTLPGEKVEATLAPSRNGFARGSLTRVITPSPQRVEPPCPYFTHCGGCSLQHASYELQLAGQRQVLSETLSRAAVTPPEEIQTLAADPWHYRNRIRLHVHEQPHWQLGYLARRSGRLLPVDQCPIAAASLEAALRILSQPDISALAPSEISEIELFTNHDESSLLLTAWCIAPRPDFFDRFSAWLAACQQSLPHLAGATAFAERTPGFAPTVVARAGQPVFNYRVAGEDYRVSAGAFFQTNLRLLDALVEHVVSVVAPAPGENIWELYAGVGLFARAIGRRGANVTAVEASPLSAKDLARNLSGLPGRTVQVAATIEQYLSRQAVRPAARPKSPTANASESVPDAIFVDPPRTGLGKAVTQALSRIASPRLVYLSCDPSTLARDLSALLDSGYHCEQLTLVDMFPQTGHIESLAVLRR
jgi:23S rRNA (uracil1939-C5)-methyltransferase